LYAAAARVKAQPTRSVPRKRVLACSAIVLTQANASSIRWRARWLAREPGRRTVRRSMRAARPAVFCATCGVAFSARRPATKAAVS
jgi:hypothetical protein